MCILQIITHGLKTVKEQVTEFTSRSIKPDDNAFGLELTAAWSTMVGVFMALQHYLTHEDVTDMLHMLQSFLNMLKMLTEYELCCRHWIGLLFQVLRLQNSNCRFAKVYAVCPAAIHVIPEGSDGHHLCIVCNAVQQCCALLLALNLS